MTIDTCEYITSLRELKFPGRPYVISHATHVLSHVLSLEPGIYMFERDRVVQAFKKVSKQVLL